MALTLPKTAKNPKLVWAIIGVLFVLYVVVIAIVKLYNPSFGGTKVAWWILIGAALFGGAAAVVYYTSRGADKLKQRNGELPAPITFMQAREIAVQALRDPQYMDDIDLDKIELEGPIAVGHPASQVYRLICWGKHARRNRYVIGVNMHYPEVLRAMMVNPATQYEINKMISGLAAYPTAEPDKKTTVVNNPVTGTQVVTEEVSHNEEASDKDELEK